MKAGLSQPLKARAVLICFKVESRLLGQPKKIIALPLIWIPTNQKFLESVNVKDEKDILQMSLFYR